MEETNGPSYRTFPPRRPAQRTFLLNQSVRDDQREMARITLWQATKNNIDWFASEPCVADNTGEGRALMESKAIGVTFALNDVEVAAVALSECYLGSGCHGLLARRWRHAPTLRRSSSPTSRTIRSSTLFTLHTPGTVGWCFRRTCCDFRRHPEDRNPTLEDINDHISS
jgi:hypothetical protein